MVYFNQTTIHKKILKTELILQNNQVTVKKKTGTGARKQETLRPSVSEAGRHWGDEQ